MHQKENKKKEKKSRYICARIEKMEKIAKLFATTRSCNHIYLNKVLCGHGRMGTLAIGHKIRNHDATIVVRTNSTDEGIADLSTDTLETTRSAGVDNQVRLGLVDGVERSQGSC